jgi:hypothetical protein
VSLSECTSSCIECKVLETWMLGVVVVGGYLWHSTTKGPLGQAVVDGHTRLSGAPPDSPVCHQTPLEALSSSGTGQSGAAPDRHCAVSGAPLMGSSALPLTVAHCSSESSAIASDHSVK